MELVFDFIMELIPDASMEFVGEHILGRIKARIRNRFLRGVIYTLAVLVLVAIAVTLALGLCLLLGLDLE